jgi:predicted GNAT family N-acyltransferase
LRSPVDSPEHQQAELYGGKLGRQWFAMLETQRLRADAVKEEEPQDRKSRTDFILKWLRHLIQSNNAYGLPPDDSVDAIKSYSRLSNGNLKVIYRDGHQLYRADITPTGVSNKLVGGVSKTDSDRMDRVTTGAVKKKKCTTGKSCKRTCIAATDTCRKEFSDADKQVLAKVKTAMGEGGQAIGGKDSIFETISTAEEFLLEFNKDWADPMFLIEQYLDGRQKVWLDRFSQVDRTYNLQKKRIEESRTIIDKFTSYLGKPVLSEDEMFDIFTRNRPGVSYETFKAKLKPEEAEINSTQLKKLAKQEVEILRESLPRREKELVELGKVRKTLKIQEPENDDVPKSFDPRRADDLLTIAASIQVEAEDLTDPTSGILAVKKQGTLAAALVYTPAKDSLYIDYLASNPASAIPNHPKAVKGGGTAAIEAAIKQSIELGKGGALTLSALHGAVPFYLKVGFSPTSKTINKDQLVSMKMDRKAAMKFLEDRKSRKDAIDYSKMSLAELEDLAGGAFAASGNAAKQILVKRNRTDAFNAAQARDQFGKWTSGAKANKGKIGTEAAVVASGFIGSAVAGPVGGAIAAATARATISIGKMIKQSGAKSFKELRSLEFQKKLEKGVQGDLFYGAIATAVNSLVPIPGAGDAVALKTSGKAVEALQRFQSRSARQ